MASLKYKTQNGYEPIPAQVVTKTNAQQGNGIGTCSTSSGTALAVTLANYELVLNGFIAVTFDHDVPASATLNVNGKGEKPIIYKGSAIEDNVIKEDDTVTFCYDGTNYIVTSLGGGGDIVWPEFVTIHLKQTDGSDSHLNGATIVVTDNDASETILSTTWQGNDIPLVIDNGVEYTITVGAVNNYATPNSQTYTAISGLSKIVEFNYQYGVIDLGLPSGIKWARGNIISNGNGGYKIGEETDYGAYFSWGNITPHFSSNNSTFDDEYDFNSTSYSTTPGASVMSNSYPNMDAVYAPNSGYDVARELLGQGFRIPTANEFGELSDNCTSVWTTKNGVVGREFTSTINGAKIFFPAAGIGVSTSLGSVGVSCDFWTSSLEGSSRGQLPLFDENRVLPYNSGNRFAGCSVRPVL